MTYDEKDMRDRPHDIFQCSKEDGGVIIWQK